DWVKIIGSIEDPIGIGRETQCGKMLFLVEFIQKLHSKTRLWKVGRTRTPAMETSACGQRGLVFEGALSVDRFIKREVGKGRTLRGRPVQPKSVHHENGQC